MKTLPGRVLLVLAVLLMLVSADFPIAEGSRRSGSSPHRTTVTASSHRLRSTTSHHSARIHASAQRERRSSEAKQAFLRSHGLRRVPPGYVVDHVVPLCAGGADRPSNMQLQTISAAKAKDRQEKAMCARRRR